MRKAKNKQQPYMIRPNKFLDSKSLEDWMLEFHKDVFEEWEFGLDGEDDFSFWEWLDSHYPIIMSEFIKFLKEENPKLASC